MSLPIPLLRKNMRKRRARLGIRLRLRTARQLVDLLASSASYKQAGTIACYLAIGGELDCSFVIKHAWRNKKRCYLPVMSERQDEKAMSFLSYRPGMMLFKNTFGIFEPINSQSINPKDLDLVLTPFVLCDKKLNRVGMGGGYYDRVFAFKKTDDGIAKPILTGLGYHFQKIAKIIPQEWDVKLDDVILLK